MGHVIINLNSESGTLYGNSVVNEICWIENRLYKFKASTQREREKMSLNCLVIDEVRLKRIT